jgi:hypothetical protein
MALSDKARSVPETPGAREVSESAGVPRVKCGARRDAAQEESDRSLIVDENDDAQSERMDWASAFSDEQM